MLISGSTLLLRGAFSTRGLLLVGVGIAGGLAALSFASVTLSLALSLTVLVASLALATGPRVGHIALGAIPASIAFQNLSFGAIPIGFLVAAVALVSLAFQLSSQGTQVVRSPIAAAVAAYLTWVVASGLWSGDPSATFQLWTGLAVSVVFAAAIVVFVQDERSLADVVWGFAVGAAASSALALFIVPDATLGAAGQVGLLGDRNFFAMYQVFAIPLIVSLASRRSGVQRTALYAAAGLSGAATIASTSRAGVVALAVVVVGLMLVPTGGLFRSVAARTRFVLGSAVAVAVALVAVGGETLARFGDQEGASGAGGSGRLNLWRAGFTAFESEPLSGIGYGAFAPRALDLQRATPSVDFRDQEPLPDLPTHSAYIGTLAELGIIGLALLAVLLATVIWAALVAYQRTRRDPSRLTHGVAAALPVSLAAWLSMSVFLSSEATRITWIAIGLAAALWALSRTPAEKAPDQAGSRGP